MKLKSIEASLEIEEEFQEDKKTQNTSGNLKNHSHLFNKIINDKNKIVESDLKDDMAQTIRNSYSKKKLTFIRNYYLFFTLCHIAFSFSGAYKGNVTQLEILYQICNYLGIILIIYSRWELQKATILCVIVCQLRNHISLYMFNDKISSMEDDG